MGLGHRQDCEVCVCVRSLLSVSLGLPERAGFPSASRGSMCALAPVCVHEHACVWSGGGALLRSSVGGVSAGGVSFWGGSLLGFLWLRGEEGHPASRVALCCG